MDNSKEFQLMLDKAIESEPLAFKNFDRTKNVQDQLQEMIGEEYAIDLLYSFHHFYNDRTSDYTEQFNSMEQLWLVFVMKENHNKEWNGEKWIVIGGK